MKKINDEKELISVLKKDIDQTSKKNIFLLGGHFPLVYNENEAEEALHYWGEFSTYTLELACKIGDYAKKMGKNVKFVFFVDDHMYEEGINLSSAQLSTRRNKLYKLRSGPQAKLPEEYRKIMVKYGFSEKDVLRHDHGKGGRKDCLYFSEKILRASLRRIDNACAREYTEVIENKKYFNKEKDYMVAFIPQRCKGHICDVALDKEIKGLSASHVFLDSMAKASLRNELYSFKTGVVYRKD